VAEDNAAAKEANAAKPEGGSKNNLILMVLMLVQTLAFAGAGLMYYQAQQKRDKEPKIEHVIKGEKVAQETQSKTDEVAFVGKLVPMETFLVNLAGSRGRKLLKVNMELEVEGEKVLEEIEKRKPQIRDIIIVLLSSKTYGQISTNEGKDFLREEIRDTVNSFLTKGKIKRVLFTEFIFN
jgi:flagellar protein FliL